MARDRLPGEFTPPFTLRQLSYLVAVADAGTIVGAAQRMYISPSTMSDAITELEKLLGTRLCVRRKAQGLTLTSAGTRAVADARRLLRSARELEIALRSRGDDLSGPLAIGCYSALGSLVVPPLLGAFASSHPALDIQIVEATLDPIVEMLDAGRIDVAFVYEPYVPGHLMTENLTELATYVLLPAEHPLADAPFVQLEDVVEEDFIMLDVPPTTDRVLKHFAACGLTPRIRHRSASPEVIRTLVAQGFGYSLLIQRIPSSLEHPVVQKEIRSKVAPMIVQAVWSPHLELTPRSTAVIEFARTIEWPRRSQMYGGGGQRVRGVIEQKS